MSWTICIPVQDQLVPRIAIESAAIGYPDAVVELIECSASGRVTGATVAADGSGEDASGLPPDASGTFAALTDEATSAYENEFRTATATGPFDRATVAHAETTGADLISVGVERATVHANPQVREKIDHIRSAVGVPYSIVHS